MYLYYNNEGTLTTQLTHSQIPRQGSNLNIVAMVSLDFFRANGDASVGDWFATIQIVNENGQDLINGVAAMTREGVTTFTKANNSEVTYDLVDDEDYYAFSFGALIDSFPNVTAQPGNIKVGITFNNSNYPLKKVIGGEATIYIEPVLNEIYLNPVITPGQYNELKELIQTLEGYLDNVVTLTTDQTITGNKTFTENVVVDNDGAEHTAEYSSVGVVINGKTIYFPVPASDDAFVLLSELNDKVAALGFSKIIPNTDNDSTRLLESIRIDGLDYKIAGGRKQIFNNENVGDYEHKEDDLWLSEGEEEN